jgi:hypothetical protein
MDRIGKTLDALGDPLAILQITVIERQPQVALVKRRRAEEPHPLMHELAVG